MSSENRIRYDGHSLEKYRKGELSPAEAHALEKASLEDPLLAEALEGFYSSTRSSEPELNYLNQWVEGRVAENQAAIRFMPKRRTFAPMLRVAAVFLVLVGAAWMSYVFWLSPATAVLADVPVGKTDSLPPLSLPESGSAPQANPVVTLTPAPEKKPTTSTISQVRPESMDAAKPLGVQDEAIKDLSLSAPPAAEVVREKPKPAEKEQVEVIVAQAENTDSRVNAETKALSSTAKKVAVDKINTISTSMPSVGWEAYEKYLSRNRVAAPTASNSITSHVVVLSFDISEEGRPKDIKVERSAGIFYDEKAVELLKKGPVWVPGNDKKRSELQVRF
jgi:hypothetical protein